MIHLDTNYLIDLAIESPRYLHKIEKWINAGEKLATSSIAWTEFLIGPVKETRIGKIQNLLEERIFPYEGRHTSVAAKLFNEAGRLRGLQADCMIAAVAIAEGHFLATLNTKDFKPFSRFGLQLIN